MLADVSHHGKAAYANFIGWQNAKVVTLIDAGILPAHKWIRFIKDQVAIPM
jgi:hypothetical protein